VPLDKVGEGTPGVRRERPDGEVVRRAIGRHVDSLERIADDFRPVIRRRLATIGATSASAAPGVLVFTLAGDARCCMAAFTVPGPSVASSDQLVLRAAVSAGPAVHPDLPH
jgi:hypothetical protein